MSQLITRVAPKNFWNEYKIQYKRADEFIWHTYDKSLFHFLALEKEEELRHKLNLD